MTRRKETQRIILHVDLDAFFASIEQRENPSLKGKPVIVGADPKIGRGVVSTASYEARKFGIHSAQPIKEAYKLCPHGIFLSPRIDFYKKVSKNIMKILKKYADKFEIAGLDEAYLDVSSYKNFKKAEKIAKRIKKEIFEKEKLTCSIGIGPNKLIAKIASDFQKPNGLTIVLPEQVKEFLKNLPIEKLPGIGKKTKELLNKYGIRKISHLRKIGKKFLTELLGKRGEEIYLFAFGIDNRPVQSTKIIKSIGKQITFTKDLANSKEILKHLDNLMKEVFSEVLKRRYLFSTLIVTVRYFDFETHTHQTKITTLSPILEFLQEKAKDLILPFLNKKPIRLIGIRFKDLIKIN